MQELFNQGDGKDTMGEGLQVKFSHKDATLVLDGTKTRFDSKSAKYEVGGIYDAVAKETNEIIGRIRILSRKRVHLFETNHYWTYEFVLELSKADEEALRRRLEALGYI